MLTQNKIICKRLPQPLTIVIRCKLQDHHWTFLKIDFLKAMIYHFY